MNSIVSRVRGSRVANLIGAILFLVGGGYIAYIASGVVQLGFGILLLLIGLLGLYNQFINKEKSH